ncbi:MAG: CoA pyrophosphatase [Tatlockia sp.]|nr:CoA pyrophosphatase [Tatlockia sp.]
MNKLSAPKEAAVIVLHELVSDSLILTQRSLGLRNHPGELCFPGGSWQEGDKDFYATALRELQEELGIAPSRVNLKQALEPERTLTGYMIYPWFASITNISPFQIDSEEVSELVRLPMTEVIKASNYKEISVSRFGLSIQTYQFRAKEYYVWGATARIMMQLIG